MFRTIRPHRAGVAKFALAALAGLFATPLSAAQTDPAPFEQWGREAFTWTKQQLGRTGEALYYESRNLDNNSTSGANGYSYIWPLSTQLRAVNQLVELDPANFTSELLNLANQMHAGYWRRRLPVVGTYPIGGYAAEYGVLGGDRFYDDNTHLVVGFVEGFRLTGDATLLERAKATHAFVMSGEWTDADGNTRGIRFVEKASDRSSNTISVLQGARGAAMLFQETADPQYLDDAVSLLAWGNAHLKTPENRYYQGYNVDTNTAGGIDIVNGTAIGISAHIELFRATGQQSYLDEAVALAKASRFTDRYTNVISDEGYWAFELVEAFNDLSLATGDRQWVLRSAAGLEWLRNNKRDSRGNYGLFWGREGAVSGNYNRVELNHMAPVIHAFLHTANTLRALALPAPGELAVDLRFDEAGGATSPDSSGQGNDAALTGSPARAAGIRGGALDLDGADDFGRLPAGFLHNVGECTVALWVNLDTIDTWSRIFDFGDDSTNFFFVTPRNGSTGKVRFEFRVRNGTTQIIDGADALPAGKWVHVAVTLAGGTGRLYVDGAQVGSKTGIPWLPSDLGISRNNYLGKSQFPDALLNGRLDDFKVYRRALGAGEVAALAAKIPAAPGGLAATAGFGNVTLAWDAASGASSYTVKRGTTTGGPYTELAGGLTTTGFSDTTGVPEKTYFYVVTASNPAGESAPSAEVSATPKSPFVPLNGTTPGVASRSISSLLAWNPATDPEAPFNISTVPLAGRIQEGPALQANPNARAGQGRIQSLDLFNGYRPQGGAGTNYLFNYWQYVSESIFWGGSAPDSLVVPPSAEIVDAAHRNGVPMMGTVFFPPGVYGGNYEWVRQFIQRDGNRFPAADKLIQMAEYFGFDGWFINQETEGGSAQDAAAFRDLIKYIRDNSDLYIVWYDSMTEAGPIFWQDQLNPLNDWYLRYPESPVGDRIAGSIFLDFVVNSETARTSRTHAEVTLGLDPFKTVYAGFEMQAGWYAGGTTARQDLRSVFPDGQDHVLSAGLYIPGAHTSTYLHTQDEFWGGSKRDPRNTGTPVGSGNWRGIAHNIAALSPVTSVPFGTAFGLGAGNDFRIRGKSTRTPQWWNRAVQDVLPTWRWIIDSAGSKLGAGLVMDDAYLGGGCLRISGNLDADNTIRLYLAKLPVQPDTMLKVVFKRGQADVASQLQVGISFESDPTNFHYFDAGRCESAGWNTAAIPVGDFAGETIAAIGLKVLAGATPAPYDLKIGQLAVFHENDPGPEPATMVQVLEQSPGSGPGKSDLHLRWDHAPGERQYYLVFHRGTDGALEYLGSTPNNRYFIEDAPVTGVPEIVVVTLGRDYSFSAPSDGLHYQKMIAHKGIYTGGAVADLDVGGIYDGFDTVVSVDGTGTTLFEVDPLTSTVVVKDAAALAAAEGNHSLEVVVSAGGAATIRVTVSIDIVDSGALVGDKLVRQFWTGFGGGLDDLPKVGGYPHKPAFVREINPVNEGDLGIDSYGSRLRAYLVPPVSGTYSLFISSDDDSRLLMSPDENPGNAAQIAFVAGAVQARNFTQQGYQNSGPRTLEAGKRYYIEVLQREGFGADHLALGWATPSNGTPTVIPASALQPFNINGAPEWAPGPRSFELPAGTAGGTVIGRVPARDPEGEGLNFAILGGNSDGRFQIDVRTGEITLADGAALGVDETVTLTVGMQDRGLGGRFPLGLKTGEITIFTGSPFIADLKFDAPSGASATDSSGNGNHASLVNGPAPAPGFTDGGLEFDGADDHALLPPPLVSGLEDFTISLWLKLDANTAWTRVFDFGENTNRFMFLTPRNGENQKVRFTIRTDSNTIARIDGAEPLPTGVWTHVAVTLSGSEGLLYVNGAEVGRNSSLQLTPSQLGVLSRNFLGRSQFVDPYLDGILDRFQMFRRALTVGEIATLAAPPAAPENLAATAGEGRIELTWDPVAGASRYTLSRAATSGGPHTVLATTSQPGFTDTDVTAGTTWFYTVTSWTGVAESGRSAELAAAPYSALELWRKSHFGTVANTGDAANDADPDGDGANNLLERAFGGDPLVADRSILPRPDPTAPRLSVIFRKAKAAGDMEYQVEETSDLLPPWAPATGTSEVIADDGTIQQIRFTRPAAEGNLFLRVKVTAP